MRDEVLNPLPHFFSFVYLLSVHLLCMCIISHHCHAAESNFKENEGTQDILIHQKSSNLVNSLFQMLRCRTIWRYYNDVFIRSDLIGQKFLNVGTVNYILKSYIMWINWQMYLQYFYSNSTVS